MVSAISPLARKPSLLASNTLIEKTDDLITAYRCHGYAYMQQQRPVHHHRELLDDAEGIAYGKGGSMHMFTKGFFAAMASSALRSRSVLVSLLPRSTGGKRATVIPYGDGASNQGQVFECFQDGQPSSRPCSAAR